MPNSTVGKRFVEWAGADVAEKIPEVQVKIKIYRIMNLEPTEGTFQVDACIMLDWSDESLGKRPEPTVSTFLNDIGLGQYADVFASNGVKTMDDVYKLDKEDLREIGVKSIVDRNAFLSKAADWNWEELNWQDHFLPSIEVTNAIIGEGDCE